MKRTASKVLPAQPRRRFPALGRERGAGRAGGAGHARGPDTSPALPGLRAAAPRSAGIPRPEPFPGRGGMPRARRSAPPGSAGYTTAPAGGSPAGPQARAYATAALLTQFHRGPKSRDPSLGFPSGHPPQDPARGAGGTLPDTGVSPAEPGARWNERRRRGRQRAPAGVKLSLPRRGAGDQQGRGSPYLG